MVFNRVVSLLAVGLVVVGSLENSWCVGVIRLSCVWIEVHSSIVTSSTCCWVSSFRPHPLHIVFVYIFLQLVLTLIILVLAMNIALACSLGSLHR